MFGSGEGVTRGEPFAGRGASHRPTRGPLGILSEALGTPETAPPTLGAPTQDRHRSGSTSECTNRGDGRWTPIPPLFNGSEALGTPPTSWQRLCSQPAHLGATSNFVPRSAALGTPQTARGYVGASHRPNCGNKEAPRGSRGCFGPSVSLRRIGGCGSLFGWVEKCSKSGRGRLRGSPSLQSGGQNHKWPTCGPRGYITPCRLGGPQRCRAGDKITSGHMWASWLHNPLPSGGSPTLQSGGQN